MTDSLPIDITLKMTVEAALFAADQPMTLQQLKYLFDEPVPTDGMLKQVIDALITDYQNRGIILQEVASGYRFQVAAQMAPSVARLWEEKPTKYSRALLETLALIAYRQPITRGEIEDIRGVSVSSHIVRTLLERGWIHCVGHKDVPGRPAMYATTRAFLDYFNLANLDGLPTLAEVKDLMHQPASLPVQQCIELENQSIDSNHLSVGLEAQRVDEHAMEINNIDAMHTAEVNDSI